MARSLRLVVLASLACVVSVPAAAAEAKVVIGIAEQKADMFSDPRFNELKIKHLRLDLPWDQMKTEAGRAHLDKWMSGAKFVGALPLITFDRSRTRKSYNPGPTEMANALKVLRARYPFVKDVATWNEANINKKPELVAKWWLALRKACPTCTVLGADLLDRGNIANWSKRFVKAAGRAPKVWGLHNYTDANTFTTTGTKTLLKAVTGDVWFTETGGVVKRRNGSTVKFKAETVAHAAAATKFVFTRLVKLSPRVKRVYLFHWNSSTPNDSWDSGFIAHDGTERPALDVLRAQLGR